MASTNDEADIDDSVPTGNALIDGLLTEYHWSFFARVNFQFTIPDSEEDYEDTRDLLIDDYPDDNHIGVRAMPAWMVAAVRTGITEYNKVLNFAITEQADNDVDTQLRFALADLTYDGDQPPPPAYAWAPQDDGIVSEQANWKSGDMFYNKDKFTDRPDYGDGTVLTEVVGSYEYHTILHETGHALGLKHGHEAGDDNPRLPANRDSMEFSVMTYRSYINSPIDTYKVAQGDYAQSLMMLDIQALQYIYGADFTTEAGNTTYRWDQQGRYFINGALQWNTDTNTIFLTIWDGGGNDTYDFSGLGSAQFIDLAAGGWTNVGRQLADLGNGNTARGNVFNALQFNNVTTDLRSLIENAIGGSGNDRIDGNIASNRLDGGGGSDVIYGVDGDDTLIGGAGADLLNGGNGFDTAEYSAATGETITITPLTNNPALGRWSITGAAQASGDVLAQIEAFRFGDGNDGIFTSGRTAAVVFNLDGRGGNDTINGGDGGDVLIGGPGTDSLRPGLGAFTVFGGTRGVGSAWIERLAENDELVVDRSADPDGYVLGFSFSPSPTGSFTGNDGSTARGISRVNYTGGVATDNVSGGIGNDRMNGAGGLDYLYGNAGNDVLEGGDGNDVLYGGEGNDNLRGGAGLDYFSAGNGNDRIETGGGGDYSVFGEAGNDTIVGATEAETLYGGIGNDSISGLGGNDYLLGQDGNDTLIGGDGNDYLDTGIGVEHVDGGGGIDTLYMNRSITTRGVSFYLNGAVGSDGSRSLSIEVFNYSGGTGNDTVRGDATNDTINGGGGNDVLEGVAGNDALYGGAGDDTLRGGAGIDYLTAGAGNDLIETGGGGDYSVFGEADNDTIIGAADAETLYGGTGNDSIFGLGGNDYLLGQDGNDTINGGDGNDYIDAGIGIETLKAGTGIDSLYMNRSATALGVSFFLNGPAGSDGSRVWDFEIFTYNGGSGNDTVRGAANNDTISGNGGNDVLDGLDGNDALYGGEGNDRLRGGAGLDYLVGGNGNDRIETGGGGDYSVFGEGGNDIILGVNDAETLYGGIGNDSISASGGNDNLQGQDGNDTLLGGNGNDYFDPGTGVEFVDGGAGIDTLYMYRSATSLGVSFFLNGPIGSDGTRALGIEIFSYNGGTGNDTVRGAENNDTISGGLGDDSLEGLAGNDALYGSEGRDTLKGGLGIDYLVGGNGDDRIETGGGGDYSVFGEAGNDTVIGANYAETLYGGSDQDSISGLGGNDYLLGQDGNDTISGGAGNDYLDGGTGNDVFILTPNLGLDTISGFDSDPVGGQDLLDVQALDFRNFNAMIASGVTIGAAGANTIIDFGGASLLTLLSIPNAAISAADFIF